MKIINKRTVCCFCIGKTIMDFREEGFLTAIELYNGQSVRCENYLFDSKMMCTCNSSYILTKIKHGEKRFKFR